jgi:hypothetical protein
MNNIWVYGCSFSEPFGLFIKDPASSEGVLKKDLEDFFKKSDPKIIENLKDGCREFDADYWGTHLASKLNMNLKSRSWAGVGWNYHNQKIDEDILKWNKDDIIIISPSYWSRVTIDELKVNFSDNPEIYKEAFARLKDEYYITTEKKWANKIKTLQFFGYNVYTWIIEKQATNEVVNNLIPVSNEYIDLYTFMHQDKKYWLGTTHLHLPHVEEYDWHLNPEGHEYISEQMYNFISNK